GSTNGSSGFTALTDLLNISPQLGALQDNGGQTLTMAPLTTSPVVDKGKSFSVSSDQRGAPRPFDLSTIANASGGDGTDIGALEIASPRLGLARVANDAVLSWPIWASTFTLQSATDVTIGWSNVGGSAVPVADQLVFTNGPIAGSKFFRLKGN